MMPVDGLEQLAEHDAIYLGAVGSPDVPDTESLWGLLIPIRREFQQYVNLRPVKTLDGVTSPLAAKHPIDFLIVRENNEGEYSEVGGRMYRGLPHESAVQETIFTRLGVSRVTRYAAGLAASRRGLLTSATKSNGIVHTMPFWDEVVEETASALPRCESSPANSSTPSRHISSSSLGRSMSSSLPICSATSCPISEAPSPARSAWRPAPT